MMLGVLALMLGHVLAAILAAVLLRFLLPGLHCGHLPVGWRNRLSRDRRGENQRHHFIVS
jgi:hypothetical protein